MEEGLLITADWFLTGLTNLSRSKSLSLPLFLASFLFSLSHTHTPSNTHTDTLPHTPESVVWPTGENIRLRWGSFFRFHYISYLPIFCLSAGTFCEQCVYLPACLFLQYHYSVDFGSLTYRKGTWSVAYMLMFSIVARATAYHLQWEPQFESIFPLHILIHCFTEMEKLREIYYFYEAGNIHNTLPRYISFFIKTLHSKCTLLSVSKLPKVQLHKTCS